MTTAAVAAAVTTTTLGVEEPLNLTPHDIVVDVVGADGQRVRLPASGVVARLDAVPQVPLADVYVGGRRVEAYSAPHFTGVVGLEHLGTASTRPIVVSSLVAEYMSRNRHAYRGAVLSPDTGPQSAVRDAAGQIVAVRRLIVYQ